MIERGAHFQPLQCAKAAPGGEEMMGLGGDRVRGGLRQRDMLFERLVSTLHLPPFVGDRGHVRKRPGGITGKGAKSCIHAPE